MIIAANKSKIFYIIKNPHITNNQSHINHNKMLAKRRRSGRIKLRIEYKKMAGLWYILLMISPEEMKIFLKDTGWKIQKIESPERAVYGAVLCKK